MHLLTSAINNDFIFKKISNVIESQFNKESDFIAFNIYAKNLAFNKDNNIQKKLISKISTMDINECSSVNYARLDNILDLLPNREFNTYLDFGCSYGNQANYFSDRLNLKKTNSFGIDAIDSINMHSNENFTRLNYGNNRNIPLPDSSIDFVTSSMVLHHVDDLLFFIKDIHRVLSSDGIFFIRETDLKNWNDLFFNLSMEHFYYNIFSNNSEISEPLFFHSRNFWANIFLNNGFTILNIEDVENGNHFNPTHFYLKKNI